MSPRLVLLFWFVSRFFLSECIAGHEKRSEAENPPLNDRYGDPLPLEAVARLGTTRLRQKDQIGALAFSPDGKILASGGPPLRHWGSRIHLWDPTTGKQIREFGDKETRGVACLLFSPDGKTLASLGDYHGLFHAGSHRSSERIPFTKIYLWDVATGKRRLTLTGHDSYVTSVAFSPDGKFLASVSPDDTVRIWDTNTGNTIRVIKQKVNGFTKVFITLDGKTLVTSSNDRSIRLWDVATGKQTRTIKVPDRWFTLDLSSDGKIAASGNTGGYDGSKIRLWDLATGKQLGECPEPGISGFWRLGPDRESLVIGAYDDHQNDTQLYLWDWKKARKIREMKGKPIYVTATAVSAEGQTLAVADSESIRLWNLVTGKEASFLAGHRHKIHSVAVSPDGRMAVTGSDDRTLRLWELPSGKPLQIWEGRQGQIFSVAFSPDGKTIASGGKNVRIWDAQSGRPQAIFSGSEDDCFLSLSFSADGKTLAGGSSGGRVYRWDVASGKEHKRVELHTDVGGVPVLPFLGVKQWVCILHGGSSIYSLNSGTLVPRTSDSEIAILEGRLHAAVFAPDGSCVATANVGNEICFRETFTNQIFHSIFLAARVPKASRVPAPAEEPENLIFSLAFSPDTRLLAAGHEDGKVALWDWPRGKELHTFQGNKRRVVALTFTRDGKYLLSGNEDGTALVWKVPERVRHRQREEKTLTDTQLRTFDADLAGGDAHKAFLALEALAAAPAKSLPLLRRRLRPSPIMDAKQTPRLIADLDSDRFAVREAAMRDLARLGDRAETLLRSTLAGKPTLEKRRRVEELLRTIKTESLYTSRAIVVLERIGTPEARQILQELAQGDPVAWQARIAKAALERIARR